MNLRFIIFDKVLRPLIIRNYRLRAEGVLPDEWYWADKLAMEWGYLVDDGAADAAMLS